MISYYIHLNSNFHIRNLLDFINGTCEIITRRNMTLGGNYFAGSVVEKSGRESKDYISGYQN